MSLPALTYWNGNIQSGVPNILRLQWDITAAVTVAPQFPGLTPAVLTTFAAISSQATIDSFLGTSSEFLVAAFDSTSMGADAMGCIINMKGQANAVGHLRIVCASGTGGATQVDRIVADSSALTSSSLATEVALGANGNIAFKVDFGNTPDFDGLTSGVIIAEISWLAK